MILARCPACETTFRVTPEQLKARAGRVRCGQCQHVFNALDALLESPLPAEPAPSLAHGVSERLSMAEAPAAATAAAAESEFSATAPETWPDIAPDDASSNPEASAATTDDDVPATADAGATASDLGPPDEAADLIAARETRSIPGYSRWSERPLAGIDGGFDHAAGRPHWPFVVFAMLLALALLTQVAFYWRTEIGARWPELRPSIVSACDAVGCTVPLPRNAELVSIEGSELQVDPERGGLLILQATLKNRAAFAQSYPLLELTLTDMQDHMVVRRVLTPKEYLPAKPVAPAAFAGGAELIARLWIDAGDSGAAGYRLYVFFP